MRRLFPLVSLGLSLLAGAGAAVAIPGDGASADTPGTSASVTPATLTAGATLHFTVSGFPAGQTVNVKIDDGKLCTDSGHGACVYHQQKIPSSGVVSGSFTLPTSLPAGPHWLRFLASAPAPGGNGTIGYTCRGDSDFTVVKAGAAPAATTSAAPRATVTVSGPAPSTSAAGTSAPTSAASTAEMTSPVTPTVSAAPATTAARPAGAEVAYAAGKIATVAAPSSAAASPSPVPSVAARPVAQERVRTSGGAVALIVVVLVSVAAAAGGVGWAAVRRWG